MFDSEIKQFKSNMFLEAFFLKLYEGMPLPDVLRTMRINPAVLAFARQQDIKLDAQIRLAQGFQIDSMVDILPNIADHYDDARMAGVVSDNIKWTATKRMRDIYGEKVDLNVNQIIDIKDVLSAAKQRVLQFVNAKPLPVLDAVTDNISDAALTPHENHDEIDPLS